MTRSRELAKILTDGNLTGTLDVAGIATANAGVKVDNITIDGTEIDLSSGDFTLDVEGKIALDANDDGSIKLQDNGTEYARIDGNSSNLRIISQISDKDIIFNGNDGGSAITALTLDMSDGGRAAFGHNADFVDGRGTRFGAGQDLQIYHDGSNSYINDTGTGSLIIRSNRHRIQSDGGENIIEAHADGAVELYYDTSKKLETTSGGVTVTGTNTDGLRLTNSNNSDAISLFVRGGNAISSTSDDAVLNVGSRSDNSIITTGNVGINNSSPSVTLDVVDSRSTSYNATGDQRSLAMITARNPSDATNRFASINLVNGGGTQAEASINLVQAGNYIGHLTFKSRTGGSTWAERMRITSAGNVGIGNTNPEAFGSLVDNLVIGTTSGENGMTIVSGTSNGGRIQFADNTASPFRGAIEYDHSSDKLIFYTAGSNRMFIGVGGRIQTFNCTGSNGALNLVGEGGLGYRAVAFQHTTNGSEVGYIATSSTNTVYNTASDYRLKENVTTSWDATSRLKQLKPSRFNFKIDKDKTVDGFLAHEVSSIVPEAISGQKDEVDDDGNPLYQGIDQSKLVPLLVKTIQELEARITALEGL